MKQILGLHIGAESIGWTLICQSENPHIVGMGTRLFSSFVHNLGEGERESSSQSTRTHIRNTRRILHRKAYRKKRILSFLAANGLCPLNEKQLLKFYDKKDKALNKKMQEWFSLNPYELRAKGVREKISKLEFGRVLFHLTQRRGKIMANVQDKSKAKILLKGLPSANRLGILETDKHLNNCYLGEYLYTLLPEHNQPYTYQSTRATNRYLDRNMFHLEFEALFDEQEKHHTLLTQELKKTLYGENSNKGLLFYQRPARYKKLRASTAICEFEKDKKSMWRSHPLNEWYEIYTWIDSITLYGKKLTLEQRELASGVALKFSSFMFKKVRIALDIEDPYAFNYQDNSKVFLSHTLVNLMKTTAFGTTFLNFTDEQQHNLWHDLHFYTDKSMLENRLRNKWGLTKPKAKNVASIKLKSGYGTASMKAALYILHYLKKGYVLRRSIFMAGVINSMGKQQWESLSKTKRDSIEYFLKAAIEENKIDDLFWIRDFYDAFGIKLKRNKLYLIQSHQKEDIFPINPFEDQMIIRMFKPVAQKPVFQLRKLINQLIDEFGKIDHINFVLAPEIKVNANQRKSLQINKKIRELELPKIYDAVLEAGQNPTHTNLYKYKLWLEWSKTCPYTNTKISLDMLFSDQVSIVYIQPWSRFFNDSDRNKALCMTYFKDEIQDKTPYEYFIEQPSGIWEQVKTRALALLLGGIGKNAPYQKFRHFALSTYSNDVIGQEFNDQHRLSQKVCSMLLRVCPTVNATRGNSISSIRRKWGISISDSFQNKSRHNSAREPALNALVIALHDKSYLEELRHWNRYETLTYRELFPAPWKRFTHDVLDHYNNISISVDETNQVIRKIAQNKSGAYSLSPKGKLHKESFFGKHKAADGSYGFHIRKPLSHFTTAKQISKIADPVIKELIYDQVDLCGGFVNGKIPKDALTMPTKTGWETKVFLPNKRGDSVPVRKVRVRENVSNAVQLTEGDNKYVNPRNNHHVLVYLTHQSQYEEEIVTFWEAVRRIRQKEPLYQLPEDGRMIISTLHINDCFILGLSQKEILNRLQEGISLWEHVYRVQRLSSKYYEFRHVYDLDLYDQSSPSYIRILNFGIKKTGWMTHKPFKISIDAVGKITPYYKPLKVPEMQ